MRNLYDQNMIKILIFTVFAIMIVHRYTLMYNLLCRKSANSRSGICGSLWEKFLLPVVSSWVSGDKTKWLLLYWNMGIAKMINYIHKPLLLFLILNLILELKYTNWSYHTEGKTSLGSNILSRNYFQNPKVKNNFDNWCLDVWKVKPGIM